jgi:hypothetical protein
VSGFELENLLVLEFVSVMDKKWKIEWQLETGWEFV